MRIGLKKKLNKIAILAKRQVIVPGRGGGGGASKRTYNRHNTIFFFLVLNNFEYISRSVIETLKIRDTLHTLHKFTIRFFFFRLTHVSLCKLLKPW